MIRWPPLGVHTGRQIWVTCCRGAGSPQRQVSCCDPRLTSRPGIATLVPARRHRPNVQRADRGQGPNAGDAGIAGNESTAVSEQYLRLGYGGGSASLATAWTGIYKRVKGRSHSVEEQLSTQS